MVSDSGKGITITYNYLDLPATVTQGTSKLVFTYDASGAKLYKQLIVAGVVTSQRHYVGDVEETATSSVASDGKVEFALMPEGRIIASGGGAYQYEYFLQDHLGNTQETFTPNTNGSLNLTQVQNYYAFGRDMGDATMNYASSPQNQYKYSDKELQPELSLNTYDFGARHYDPKIGRWMSSDPLAEDYEDLSPYNYVANSPLNHIDPNGEGILDNLIIGAVAGAVIGGIEGGDFKSFATGFFLGGLAGASVGSDFSGIIAGGEALNNALRSPDVNPPNAQAFNYNLTAATTKGIGPENLSDNDPEDKLGKELTWRKSDARKYLSAGVTVLVSPADLNPIADVVAMSFIISTPIIYAAEVLRAHLDLLRSHTISMSQGKTADELIPASVKRSPSYNPKYGNKTREELVELAKMGDKIAKDMKKLIDQAPRLLRKNKNK